eukprot:scaffold5532_cov195-Cylindrotheca_fusiformis.AAC.5
MGTIEVATSAVGCNNSMLHTRYNAPSTLPSLFKHHYSMRYTRDYPLAFFGQQQAFFDSSELVFLIARSILQSGAREGQQPSCAM